MKKTLLLLASAAMLLVGCAKEQLSNGVDGGMTNVTFTASLDGGVATKADIDNDGKGTYVNRCIMEIYFQDQLYKRMVVPTTDKIATFANVPVVAGKQYQILFWADCGGAEKADKYYTTTNLKAVTVAKGAFIGALQNKENDKLDAFFGAEDYTVTPSYHSFDITLKRPFAQLNVITTDVAAGKTVTSADLLPDKVSVSYEADNILNVATGETSRSETETDYTFAYEAPVYGAWSTVASNHELTLSMDYILAPATEQGAVDVTFKTKNGETVVMNHSLANLPYKRNYRTNVKGDLLTVGGTWTATIDADWLTPDIVKVVEVADIQSANEIIEQYASTTKQLEVKFTAEPNDSGEPTGEATSAAKAIVTTPIKANNTLSIEVLAETKKLYIGDYPNEYTVTSVDTENAEHAIVNVNVPKSSKIETLYINAPTKSVYINGKEVANVGTITNLDAITSPSTLIIEKDQTVTNLTVHQGGLEIHGTVGTLVISENDHDNNPVLVRTSENLSQEVFEVIYEEGEGGHDYIDRPNFSEKQNANGTWDIVPSVCKIGEKAYGTLKAAVEAVPEGIQTTITMIDNHAVDVAASGTITIPSGKNIILDLNGREVAGVCSSGNASALITNNGSLKIIDNGATKGKISYGATPSWIYQGELIFTGSYVSNLITNHGTLVIDGANLDNQADGSACFAIDIYAGSVTVDNGYIKAAKSAVRMFYGTGDFTFNSGTIDAGRFNINSQFNTDSNHHITINGGNILTSDPDRININTWSGNSENNTNCSIEINGGTFNGVVSQYRLTNVSVNGGYFYAFCSYVEDVKPIKGGFYESNKFIDGSDEFNLADFVAEKYDLTENTDAATKAQYPYTVGRKGVAQIGTTIYYDLKDAIDAVPTGTETQTLITMLDNVSATATFTISSDKNICLELNGKSIFASSSTSSQGFPLFANKGIFTVQDKTDTHKDGTGTGKLSTIAYDPDMRPVPGYATNTITNYGTLNIKSGLVESGSNGLASFAIDNEAENAQWNNSSNKTITLNVSGGRIISGQSNSIRMYLATNGQYDNVIKIENAYIGSLWVQDNVGAAAAKGKLTILNSTFEHNLTVGYECVSEHFSLNVSNSVFGSKVHYQLNSEAEGNTISLDNISAAPFFMDTPKKVLHNGTVTIKGEFPYGWVYVEDENTKAELEAAGWRLETDPNYSTWFHGYLTEEGILNYLKECIEDGYDAVCVDQTAGKYEIKAK